MMTTSTSKNIDGVQEITLIAPLKTGVVPYTGKTLSYASRLRLFLGALFDQRKSEVEVRRVEGGFLEKLQILDFVRWAIIDNDTKLMLAVSFDGPWEPYIRKIVDDAGPVLDAIFCHCAEYAGHSCFDGYPKFSAWVRENQVDIPFIHVANAELTVDDVRYLKTFEAQHATGNATPFAIPPVVYEAVPRPLSRAYALFGLRSVFVGPGGTLNDQEYFDRVAYVILKPDFPALNQAIATLKAANQARGGHVSDLGLRNVATATWLAQLQEVQLNQTGTPPRPPPATDVTNAISEKARADIQGNILNSYANTDKVTHGAFALLRFKSRAHGAAFLRYITPQISFEVGANDLKINLSLCFEGLTTLGLTDDELALFPQEFREGLEARAALLGDVGDNHPDRWSLPKANWPTGNSSGHPIRLSLVDAVLNLQMHSDYETHELCPSFTQFLKALEAQGDIEILHVQPTRRYADGLGHLGAVDGMSQPVANGEEVKAPYAARDVVPVGELLLGYQNRNNEPSALPKELASNSTFIAIRKMRQDPAVYKDMGRSQLELALGRGTDGRNLITNKQDNDFEYAKDPNGAKCPFFSHVRRSNPRLVDKHEDKTPRILRRGMTYGPKFNGVSDKYERGVMFTAIAASLAEQYEVVQRWVNGGNVTGVFSGHPDLIAGTHPHDSGRQLQYPNEKGGSASVNVPSKPAAGLDWGLYGYVPSRSALTFLGQPNRPLLVRKKTEAELEAEAKTKAEQQKAAQPTEQFGAEPLSEAGSTTKAQLEDVLRPKMIGETLKKLVANKEGLGRAENFGVIIGLPDQVTDALSDPTNYSVRSYWKRMVACKATLYLGMDPAPNPKQFGTPPDPYPDQVKPGDYVKESTDANAFIESISFDEARDAAHAAALHWFKEQDFIFHELGKAIQSVPALAQPIALDLVTLAQRVIRDVACALYGLPTELLSDDTELEWPANTAPATAATAVRCPVDLTAVFAHVFPPRPSPATSEAAHASGFSINEKISKWYASPASAEQRGKSRMITAVSKHGQSDDLVVRTIIGLLSGFAVPTFGTLVGVLGGLVASDQLWRQQHTFRDLPQQEFMKQLMPLVYSLMIRAPVPAMISRTPMFERGPIKGGEVVGVHLGFSAAAAQDEGREDAWKFLFGDLPAHYAAGQKEAIHACPGQAMALGVIVGTVTALLEQPRLKNTSLSALILSQYE
ncbi:MAG TPA: hypothetical protein VER96_27390 [Polyangiaceae bacterium]|nr:hypothetical protein [Polyangiaceae bacterium]